MAMWPHSPAADSNSPAEGAIGRPMPYSTHRWVREGSKSGELLAAWTPLYRKAGHSKYAGAPRARTSGSPKHGKSTDTHRADVQPASTG